MYFKKIASFILKTIGAAILAALIHQVALKDLLESFRGNIWQWPALIIIFVIVMFLIILVDWQKTMRDIKNSLGFFGHINRIPMNNILSNYHGYYHSSKEDELIRTQLSKGKKVLIVGKPLSGKTRAALEAIKSVVSGKAYLLIPKNATSESMRNLRIPRTTCFLGSKPSIVIFLDDLPIYSPEDVDALVRNVRRDAKKDGVWIVATCRKGDLSQVQQNPKAKDICRELLDPIKLLDIDQTTGEEIAAKIGSRFDLYGFDGTTGSIVIGIGDARNRFEALTDDAVNALKSLRILRSIGLKEWDNEYIWLVCKSILKSKLSLKEAREPLEELNSEGFVKFSKQKTKCFYVEARHDIYLDASFMGDLSDSVVDWIGFYEELSQIFINKHDYGALLNLGNAFFQIREYKKAEEVLDKCIRLKPNFPIAYEYKINLLFTKGRLKEGESTLKQWRSINRDKKQEARFLLGIGDIIYYRLGDLVGAANKFEQALDLIDDPEIKLYGYNKYGALYLVDRQFEEAEKCYLLAINEAEDQSPEIKANIGADLVISILVQRNDLKTEGLLNKVFAFAKENNLIAVTWSRILIRIGELLQGESKSPENCEQTCLKIVALDDPSGEQLNAIAFLTLNEGKLKQARRIYEFCIQNNPNKLEKAIAILNIGALLSMQKEYTEAMPYYKEAKSMLEGNYALTAIAVGNIGDCVLHDLHDIDRAMELYEESKELADKARDCTEQIDTAQINTAQSGAFCGLADVFLAQGETNKAVEYYQEAMKIPVEYSAWPYIYLGFGKALTKSGQFKNARYYLLSGKEMSKHVEIISDFDEALSELNRIDHDSKD